MNTDQQKEFTRLYLTGKYTQKQCAKQVGVSAVTACDWVRDIPELKYTRIRKRLANQLDKLSRADSYEQNADAITRLISDLERLDGLIRKAKYIPHLQG